MNYSIDIKLTEQDYVKFVTLAVKRACQKHSGALDENSLRTAVINLVLWCCIAIVFVSIFQSLGGKEWKLDWISVGIGALPLIVLNGIVQYNLRTQQKRCMPRENGTTFSPKRMEISEQGITETSETTTSFYAWSCVDEMVDEDGDIYIFLDTVVAHIIPATAFQSDAHQQQFKSLVDGYLNNADQPLC